MVNKIVIILFALLVAGANGEKEVCIESVEAVCQVCQG